MNPVTKISLGCVGLVFVTGYSFVGLVSCDVGEHCDLTGSTRSWTRWMIGIKTGYCYDASALESFLAAEAPEQLEHKWVSYSGTGKNIFGKPVFHGHGRPNELSRLSSEDLDAFVETSPPETVFELYETLRRGDPEEIRSAVERIREQQANRAGPGR